MRSAVTFYPVISTHHFSYISDTSLSEPISLAVVSGRASFLDIKCLTELSDYFSIYIRTLVGQQKRKTQSSFNACIIVDADCSLKGIASTYFENKSPITSMNLYLSLSTSIYRISILMNSIGDSGSWIGRRGTLGGGYLLSYFGIIHTMKWTYICTYWANKISPSAKLWMKVL